MTELKDVIAARIEKGDYHLEVRGGVICAVHFERSGILTVDEMIAMRPDLEPQIRGYADVARKFRPASTTDFTASDLFDSGYPEGEPPINEWVKASIKAATGAALDSGYVQCDQCEGNGHVGQILGAEKGHVMGCTVCMGRGEVESDPMPPVGPLTSTEGLKVGDVLRVVNGHAAFDNGTVCRADEVIVGAIRVGPTYWNHDRFAFVARPGVWMPWEGGENPVPGMQVRIKWDGEEDVPDGGITYHSAAFNWSDPTITHYMIPA